MIRTVTRCERCGFVDAAHLGLTIDPRGKRLAVVGGQSGHITHTQRDVLEALIESSGATLSRERLWHRVYGHRHDGGPQEKIIDVVVCKLRALLARIDAPVVIVTDWGRGYHIERLDAAEAALEAQREEILA